MNLIVSFFYQTVTKTPRTITHVNPNGSTVWFLYCEDDKKPFGGMIFENLEKAFDFYTGYARNCGFDIRSATTYKSKGVIVLKYIVCSREGFMVSRVKKNKGDTIQYKRSTKRVGCNAKLESEYEPKRLGFEASNT